MVVLYLIWGVVFSAALIATLFLLKRPAQFVQRNWRKNDEDTLVHYQKGTHWVTEPDAEMDIRRADRGIAAIAPQTIWRMWDLVLEKLPNQVALKVERDGAWKSWTWSEYHRDVMTAGRALIALGVEKYGTVNIIGFNSPEWLIANNAAIAAGGKAAGIYTTNGPEACKYITEHSEAAVVVVENADQLEKFLTIRHTLPKLKAIVQWVGTPRAGANVNGQAHCYSWAEFMALGKETYQEELSYRLSSQRPNQCCTLIYTSGTTGNPKAVMISHDNLTWTSQSLIAGFPKFGTGENEHVVSYLPLSHIAAQILDIHAPLVTAATQNTNVTVWFARPDALKGSLVQTLRSARPTLFFGVPRVWEKMEEKMKAIGAKNKGVVAKIGAWAKGLGSLAHSAQQVGGGGELPRGYDVANQIIFAKIKKGLGLDRAKLLYTGAAPIAHSTLKYFGSIGLNVMELYGMSETTGPSSVSLDDYFRVGACGPAMNGVEVKIDHVEGRDKPGEGEICMRGRHIMMGYMKNPEKTAETFDEDGFLHSGDVGTVDADGLLKITGRIKELIITAGGENVAPVPIEDRLKDFCPILSNAMMVGDQRKFNCVLVTLKTEPDGEGGFTDKLAGEAAKATSATTLSQAIKDPKINQIITDAIKKTNSQAVSNAQKLQKFFICPKDFSVPDGDLTPTLKLKRSIVSQKYNKEIEAWYA